MKHNLVKNLVLGCYAAILSLLLSANRAEAAHRLRWTFQANTSVNSLAFSPQNNLLAVGTDFLLASPERKWQTCLYLLSAKTGQIAYRFATQGHVQEVAFTPDGRLLLDINGLYESFGQLDVWDLKTKKLCSRFKHPGEEQFTSMALSPDGKMAACGTWDQIYLVAIPSCKLRYQLMGRDGESFSSLSFSPDSKHLLGTSDQGSVRIWDAASGRLSRPETESGFGYQGSYLKDGRICLTRGSFLKTLGPNLSDDLDAIKSPFGSIGVLAVEKSGVFAATGSDPTRIWNLQTQKLVEQLDNDFKRVNTLAFSSDSSLALGSADHIIKFWEVVGQRSDHVQATTQKRN